MTVEECWILVFLMPMALGYVLMLASILKDDINEWKESRDGKSNSDRWKL